MSNSPNNREQNAPMELSHNQSDPGSAKATDFPILHDFDEQKQVPFHGQSGETLREYHQLLQEHPANQPLPDLNEAPVRRAS